MTIPLLDMAPLLFFTFADNGIIQDVNNTACIHLGYKKSELVGEKIEKIFTLATRIFHQTHLFPLLKMQGNAEEIFITLESKNGEQLPVLFNFKRINTAEVMNNTAAGIIVHNRKKFEDELIAARRAAERALNENTHLKTVKADLQQQAEQLDSQLHLVSKQNAELWQFNRVVTHDLQEPLRKLLVFSSMLEMDDRVEDAKNTVSRISRVLRQMQKVISSLQQYVWLAEDKPTLQAVDLDTLFKNIITDVAEENPQVNITTAVEKVGSINADPDQIEFVLREIISNSVRFRKKNTVTIDISSRHLQKNKFRNLEGKYTYGDFLKLEISDDGRGFDNAYSHQVFDLFKRLHPESGSGVGLSLCRKIVESNDGMITVESAADKGTTVNIYWPS